MHTQVMKLKESSPLTFTAVEIAQSADGPLTTLTATGAKDELARVGVELTFDLSHVGKHLTDHSLVLTYYCVNSNTTFNDTIRESDLFASTLELREDERKRDCSLQIRPKSAHIELLFTISRLWIYQNEGNFLTVIAAVVSPRSEGSLALASAEGGTFIHPNINYGLLTNEFDLVALQQALRDADTFLKATPWTSPSPYIMELVTIPTVYVPVIGFRLYILSPTMRLLHTETFEVKEFLTDSDIPIFAILSHTWGKDEVTFQDIQNLENAKRKAGWSKVWNACNYVRQYKYDWIWIDTCCIDKSSSAELSEALNSMYQYYGDGRVCIAYLSDVSWEKNIEELKKSRWFKRGWTLQELIAPHYMIFSDKDWNKIGTRYSMRHVISGVTSVPVDVFKGGRVDGYSIAQKMSWAASRETTRPEDMAYCLMGLFGVNMPPIYGEGGPKAFRRLQQEIIKYSDDRSIFAWVASQDDNWERGLFASSPSEFALSGDVEVSESGDLRSKSVFSFGNNGLHIHLPLQHLPDFGEDTFLASLHCRKANKYIGIYLQQKGHHYIRFYPHFPLPHFDTPSGELGEVVVKESAIPRQRDKSDDYEIPIEFKLDDSQITLLGEVDGSFDKNPRSVQSLSLCRDSDRYFRAQTKKGNKFTVNLWRPSDSVLRVLFFINNHYIPDLGDSYYIPLLQDSVLSHVHNSSALVSCSIHMTGDSSRTHIVELNYIPSSSAQFELYHQIDEFKSSLHALSSTSMNFMLDTTSISPSFVLKYGHTAVSSNLLCNEEGKRVYGTLSDFGEQHDIHCVLAYYHYDTWRDLKRYIFVALGLRTESEGDIPWIDVTVSSEMITISGIWGSYLPSGSRYGCRNKQKVTVSDYYSYDFTVEKRTSGLVWFHVVVTKINNFARI
ncbi:HET-domain-containing protein [Dendrothele bispora CBS 962.96]|uniref:HET-domain-containing protein n=1 Tax=Dendrothele bispora (strain CBS 962.96) TaxID=1314807 RepID=A0A4S8L3T7_DENBC|nr:HET-domain-containing protein [Dendrothele bispora CBS 962.96]